MATYTLDWSETDLGGSAVVSYGSGAVLDFTDKPAAATSALSLTAHQSDGVDNILAEFTIETTGASVMTFDYKVSTESGWDKFHIDVDGVSRANYSGLVAWTSHTGINIASAGVHTIRFRYTKDPGGSGNADRVWVALLNITNTVTTNDASGTVETSDMEDGAIPAAVTTSTWTNSTSEPIAGTRSLRSPAAPANSGSYDLTVTKPAGSDYATVGFNYKVSSEAGWDKLFIFPDATATNVPASGSPSTPGESGWLDYSGTQSGRLAVILPAVESTILLRYTKDGGGAGGSDAAWIDSLSLPAASGGAVDLTPADSAHGHTSESPALTQVHSLAPVDSAHAHAAESSALTQVHSLAPADSSHGHTADSPTLTQANNLAPADSAHGHTSDSPALTQAHALTPADSSHTHGADSPTLTQVHALAPDDSSHAHSSESPTLSTGLTLVPDSSTHGHTADTPALTQVHELAPADSSHEHATEAPTLTQVHVLAPADSLHAHGAESPAIVVPTGLPPPAERLVVVPAEDRTIVVPAESRTITVPAESRTLPA